MYEDFVIVQQNLLRLDYKSALSKSIEGEHVVTQLLADLQTLEECQRVPTSAELKAYKEKYVRLETRGQELTVSEVKEWGYAKRMVLMSDLYKRYKAMFVKVGGLYEDTKEMLHENYLRAQDDYEGRLYTKMFFPDFTVASNFEEYRELVQKYENYKRTGLEGWHDHYEARLYSAQFFLHYPEEASVYYEEGILDDYSNLERTFNDDMRNYEAQVNTVVAVDTVVMQADHFLRVKHVSSILPRLLFSFEKVTYYGRKLDNPSAIEYLMDESSPTYSTVLFFTMVAGSLIRACIGEKTKYGTNKYFIEEAKSRAVVDSKQQTLYEVLKEVQRLRGVIAHNGKETAGIEIKINIIFIHECIQLAKVCIEPITQILENFQLFLKEHQTYLNLEDNLHLAKAHRSLVKMGYSEEECDRIVSSFTGSPKEVVSKVDEMVSGGKLPFLPAGRNDDDVGRISWLSSDDVSANNFAVRLITRDSREIFDIDVYGDGNCLLYAFSLSYLLPHLNKQEEFKLRFDKLFTGDSEKLRRAMENYTPNAKWYADNLYQLVNTGETSLRSKLVQTLEVIKTGNLELYNNIMESYEGRDTLEKVKEYIIKSGSFGNEAETILLALLTKSDIMFVSEDGRTRYFDSVGGAHNELKEGMEIIASVFFTHQQKDGGQVGHYHAYVFRDLMHDTTIEALNRIIDPQHPSLPRTDSFGAAEPAGGGGCSEDVRYVQRIEYDSAILNSDEGMNLLNLAYARYGINGYNLLLELGENEGDVDDILSAVSTRGLDAVLNDLMGIESATGSSISLASFSEGRSYNTEFKGSTVLLEDVTGKIAYGDTSSYKTISNGETFKEGNTDSGTGGKEDSYQGTSRSSESSQPIDQYITAQQTVALSGALVMQLVENKAALTYIFKEVVPILPSSTPRDSSQLINNNTEDTSSFIYNHGSMMLLHFAGGLALSLGMPNTDEATTIVSKVTLPLISSATYGSKLYYHEEARVINLFGGDDNSTEHYQCLSNIIVDTAFGVISSIPVAMMTSNPAVIGYTALQSGTLSGVRCYGVSSDRSKDSNNDDNDTMSSNIATAATIGFIGYKGYTGADMINLDSFNNALLTIYKATSLVSLTAMMHMTTKSITNIVLGFINNNTTSSDEGNYKPANNSTYTEMNSSSNTTNTDNNYNDHSTNTNWFSDFL